MSRHTLEIIKTKDFDLAPPNSSRWDEAERVEIAAYWSGESAPAGRSFEAGLLWSDAALYVRFEARQAEPLVVSESPDTSRKTHGLWNRDVCEIFIAPDRSAPHKYFEFEVAPTGEWIDIGIEFTSTGRVADWDYASGMESAARVDSDKVVMTIKIPFSSLGGPPNPGDVWLGNLFRCIGEGPTRGYLAWRPTRTEKPSFHVPEAFGEFRFA